MFTHILAPYDGSKHAMAALDNALGLRELTGARLSILTVYRHHSILEASFSMVRPDDFGDMDDAMRSYAVETADVAKRHAIEAGADDVRAFVRNGPVARAIIGFANENDVDLIVMGGRGIGSVEGYLLGSVSHKVTGMANCPVLVA